MNSRIDSEALIAASLTDPRIESAGFEKLQLIAKTIEGKQPITAALLRHKAQKMLERVPGCGQIIARRGVEIVDTWQYPLGVYGNG
jgi:hypothetical protein